jgi:hypothetical protein
VPAMTTCVGGSPILGDRDERTQPSNSRRYVDRHQTSALLMAGVVEAAIAATPVALAASAAIQTPTGRNRGGELWTANARGSGDVAAQWEQILFGRLCALDSRDPRAPLPGCFPGMAPPPADR